MRAINEAFADAGISIAFPQRDLHLDTTQPLHGILERSVPPFTAGVERSPLPGERFAAALDARLATAAEKDVYMYVHGYKVDYENPVLVAAELWNFLGNDGAFIAYGWPSTSKTLAYWS